MRSKYTISTTQLDRLDEEPDTELAAILRERPDVEWGEEEYLELTDSWNHPIEFSGGVAEVLGGFTISHQAIARNLLMTLFARTQRAGGKVLFGIRVRLWHRK